MHSCWRAHGWKAYTILFNVCTEILKNIKTSFYSLDWEYFPALCHPPGFRELVRGDEGGSERSVSGYEAQPVSLSVCLCVWLPVVVVAPCCKISPPSCGVIDTTAWWFQSRPGGPGCSLAPVRHPLPGLLLPGHPAGQRSCHLWPVHRGGHQV